MAKSVRNRQRPTLKRGSTKTRTEPHRVSLGANITRRRITATRPELTFNPLKKPIAALTPKLHGLSAARARRIAQRTHELTKVEQVLTKRDRRRRIAFGDLDACHLYEWLVFYWSGDRRFGGCPLCQTIGQRLRQFIGPQEAARLARLARSRMTHGLPHRPLGKPMPEVNRP